MKHVAANYVPRNKRILVEQPPLVKQIGGVYLPDTSQFRPNKGKIIAMDPLVNEPVEKGGAGESFEVGNNVLFHKDVGIKLNINGQDLLLLHVNEILMSYDEAPEK
jgi:co-chaperonin GroES (HSP10)